MSTNEGQVEDAWGDERSPSPTSSWLDYPMWAFRCRYRHPSLQTRSGWRLERVPTIPTSILFVHYLPLMLLSRGVFTYLNKPLTQSVGAR